MPRLIRSYLPATDENTSPTSFCLSSTGTSRKPKWVVPGLSEGSMRRLSHRAHDASVRGVHLRRAGRVPPVTLGVPATTTKPVADCDLTCTKNCASGDTQVSPTLNIEPSLLATFASGLSASWL